MVPSRPKILFVSETVTLSHAARPAVLASALDPHAYEVVLAWDPRYASLFPNLSFPTTPIHVVDNDIFNAALKTGKPFLDEATLRFHVEEDRRLLRKIQPDVVVGDFRLSPNDRCGVGEGPSLGYRQPTLEPFCRLLPAHA
jgi:UDP:flavonoid glycosyltransferase YjiC (YdhE family)